MSVPESIIDSQISVKEVKAYVYNLLEKKLSATIYFHTLDHTERVYRAVKKISKAEKIPKAERYLLYIAALFNDAGFSTSYTNHEEESALLAHKYLRDKNFTERQLRIIDRLINSTKSGVAPVTKLQKILCDANVAYVGDVEYFYYADLLRKEREHNEEDYSPTDLQWAEENLQFLQQHYFFSRAATKLYQENKLKNIRKARKSLKKELAIEKAKWENFSVAKNKAALTMFKTALRNHIDLTAIADQKSNMMLSVNAFLLTIGLPIFASYLTEKVYLLVPSILFMFTCVITMIYATLATRPMKMDGKTNLSKIHANKTNLFFFGNFYKIPLESYHEAIKKVITNRESLDTSIINDLYFLGHSLGDKFRYLRICYNVFIVGIFSCVIAFLISYFLMQ